MKNLLALLLLLPLVALSQGQGTAVRANAGFATNLTVIGTVSNMTLVRMGSSALGSTFILIDTNGLNRIAIGGTAMTFRDTNNIRFRIDGDAGVSIYASNGNLMASFNTNVANFLATVASTNFVGNGSGLTNLPLSGPWTNSSGTVRLVDALTSVAINTNTGGIMLGKNAEAGFGPINPSEGFILLRDPANGDNQILNFHVISVSDVNVFSHYSEINASIETNSMTVLMNTTSADGENGVRVLTSPGTSELLMFVSGSPVVQMLPGAGDGITPFVIGSFLTHAAGNLLELQNNTVNKFTVGFDGATTIGATGLNPGAAVAALGVTAAGTLTTNAVNASLNVASNITVSGKGIFTQQIFITKAESSTNAGPTDVIDFTKDYYFISTNNNLSFGPATGWSTTNWNEVLYVFTNSSAGAKTIAMHGTYQNSKAEEGNTLHFTNVARLLVWGQNVGTGTNFDFKSR